MQQALKSLDAFPKTLNEFQVRTFYGGVISLVSFVFIAYLLVSELGYYFEVVSLRSVAN